MKVTATELPGVTLIEPQVYGDARGFFVETFQADRYREQPGVQLTGDPIEADQVMLHPAPSCSFLGNRQHRPAMLRRNIKPGKGLLNYD